MQVYLLLFQSARLTHCSALVEVTVLRLYTWLKFWVYILAQVLGVYFSLSFGCMF